MFSSGVRLGDLDDFLGPAQDCVAPLLIADGKVTVSGQTTDRAEKPVLATPQRPDLIKKKTKKGEGNEDATTKAEVSLSDCLACSGCVTSAETVLLQEQSVEEFTRRAKSPHTIAVVSISPESLVSLSDHFALDAVTTMRKLSHVLTTQYGVQFVCDMHAAYYIHKWERCKNTNGNIVMSSTCPGWTLYAEKVCDASILPKMSTVRSPQHIQGSLVKRHFVPKCVKKANDLYAWTRYTRVWWGDVEKRIHPWWDTASTVSSSSTASSPAKKDEKDGGDSGVYHVMVSPCFDRKIEAVRPSYTLENGDREVDTVLATTELLTMLPADFASSPDIPPDGAIYGAWNLRELTTLPRPPSLWDNSHSDEINHDDASLHAWKEIRSDLYEIVNKDGGKFVRAYGFKNIQNAIRRVRTAEKSKEKISMIEVMACPSSCLNGGGQIRSGDDSKSADATAHAATERVARLKRLWPTGDMVEVEGLRFFYENQPQEYWQTEFHSLKGTSLKW
eukprot:GEMP01046352.1.p1 GENE.GEMP01046352.1~~GEMP01046352.1.p1  ORF type:complete len:503 (+),score=153.35 GEMP01046352.1:22-1530(+)